MVGFALGLIVGALVAFEGGRRFDRFQRQYRIARDHARDAQDLAAQALGTLMLFVVVVIGAGALIWSRL